MSDPVINLDEPIGKWVGRRKLPGTSLEAGMKLQREGSRLRAALRVPRPPKGVFRFTSHAEADEWWMKVWTSNRKN